MLTGAWMLDPMLYAAKTMLLMAGAVALLFVASAVRYLYRRIR